MSDIGNADLVLTNRYYYMMVENEEELSDNDLNNYQDTISYRFNLQEDNYLFEFDSLPGTFIELTYREGIYGIGFYTLLDVKYRLFPVPQPGGFYPNNWFNHCY